ncbi:hypothetical protein BV25DRAFT_1846343 [Artomyces pyxidatus]|uniref:Uncharacterized protein n=1 Tax=Artomyces pyxidatus TaxID=48021 RepID=A0ACB8TIS3_9AGAM|nr:hypothetical protein BV25DRAFT_1846343 [Artomyces pyxidatus]
MYMLWVILAVIIAACFVFYMLGKTSDPYGTFHLALNERPGETGQPHTEWLNMGFWKETDVFPDACQALALRLCQAATLRPRGRVLDVGHGSGDSLLLHLSHPALPRPRFLCGITSLPSHHARSQERVDHILSSQPILNNETEVILYADDALWRPHSPKHPLAPDSELQFDSVLALDCAYHFRTRSDFLRQSFSRLAPGGRIALADICFLAPPSSASILLLSSILRVMPRENIVTKEAYVKELEDIGYVDVLLEDITQWVFPGFRTFLKTQGLSWRFFAGMIGQLQGLGVCFVVVSGSRKTL